MTTHDAAKSGNISTVGELLQNKQLIKSTDSYSRTPLHWAGDSGHFEIVVALVEEYGANINFIAHNDHLTPLQTAALKGHRETCEYLISKPEALGCFDALFSGSPEE